MPGGAIAQETGDNQMVTDNEMIDALLNKAIRREQRTRKVPDADSAFMAALVHVMDTDEDRNIPSTLWAYRRADEAKRAAIDDWMIQLVGYSVPALLLMANQIAAGEDPMDAEAAWSDESGPTYKAHMRIFHARLEARDKAAVANCRSLFGNFPGSRPRRPSWLPGP